VIWRLGGTATAADILRQITAKALRCAEARGEVERISRGVYALANTSAEKKAAAAAHGTLSHQTAARHWLMESMFESSSIHVTVAPGSRPASAKGVSLHYAEVTDEKVTSPLRTVLDCARQLPFREALAIADSACRRQLVSPDELVKTAERLRGPGVGHARRVAAHADGRADNPFESGLRAIAIEVGITGFEPQLVIPADRLPGMSHSPAEMRVDLGDPDRMIVFEADSFAYHGTREALERDCRRYDELVSRRWLVLRFSWEQVMYDQDWVGQMMIKTCALRTRGAVQARNGPR
jgi:hypothetical protein